MLQVIVTKWPWVIYLPPSLNLTEVILFAFFNLTLISMQTCLIALETILVCSVQNFYWLLFLLARTWKNCYMMMPAGNIYSLHFKNVSNCGVPVMHIKCFTMKTNFTIVTFYGISACSLWVLPITHCHLLSSRIKAQISSSTLCKS